MPLRRFAATILGALAVLLALAACAPARPLLGVADQKASSLQDPRLAALGLTHARLDLPWDVLADPPTLEVTDLWMAQAKRSGLRPLVTIDRSRRPGRAAVNPTPQQLATQLRRWRARWPGQVREISSWNEANLNKRPELVARWWRALRLACPSCTVLGADLLDRGNVTSWARRFIRAAGREPAVWGLHDYADANCFTTSATAAVLRAVKGRIWLTETGGVLKRAHPGTPFAGQGSAHAARATDFLLRHIVPLSSRISRVYLYSWATGPFDLSWDSGLVGPTGLARPALTVVRSWLHGRPSPALPPAARRSCTRRSATTPGAPRPRR